MTAFGGEADIGHADVSQLPIPASCTATDRQYAGTAVHYWYNLASHQHNNSRRGGAMNIRGADSPTRAGPSNFGSILMSWTWTAGVCSWTGAKSSFGQRPSPSYAFSSKIPAVLLQRTSCLPRFGRISQSRMTCWCRASANFDGRSAKTERA